MQCFDKCVTLEVLNRNSSFGLYHNSMTFEDKKTGLPLKIPYKPKILFRSRILQLNYRILRKLRMKYEELNREFEKNERYIRAFGMPFCDFVLYHEQKMGTKRI